MIGLLGLLFTSQLNYCLKGSDIFSMTTWQVDWASAVDLGCAIACARSFGSRGTTMFD
jgi:hypothetical protein